MTSFCNCFTLRKGIFLNQYASDCSLTVARGFSSARESFLILIDPILGKRGNTWSDAFVRLHGMLFARLSLDSFDDELDAFFEVFSDERPLPEQWARLAVINIAAIYQYNRRDSLLKESLRQGRREKREADLEETVPAEEVADGDAILPTSHADNVQMDLANVVRAGKFTNIPFDIRSDDHEDVSLSKIVFEKSCLVAFSLLSEVLNAGLSEIFVHVWLMFLAYSLRYQPVVRLLERKIPWQELVEFLNDVNDDIQVDSANTLSLDELAGPVLLEDPIMRGFEWSRKVFPKGWFQDVDPVVELEDPTAGSNERKHRILSLGIQISKVHATS
jgi:protein SMG6